MQINDLRLLFDMLSPAANSGGVARNRKLAENMIRSAYPPLLVQYLYIGGPPPQAFTFGFQQRLLKAPDTAKSCVSVVFVQTLQPTQFRQSKAAIPNRTFNTYDLLYIRAQLFAAYCAGYPDTGMRQIEMK